jgi:hypothetical protein
VGLWLPGFGWRTVFVDHGNAKPGTVELGIAAAQLPTLAADRRAQLDQQTFYCRAEKLNWTKTWLNGSHLEPSYCREASQRKFVRRQPHRAEGTAHVIGGRGGFQAIH